MRDELDVGGAGLRDTGDARDDSLGDSCSASWVVGTTHRATTSPVTLMAMPWNVPPTSAQRGPFDDNQAVTRGWVVSATR
jgi:hypothetical protein